MLATEVLPSAYDISVTFRGATALQSVVIGSDPLALTFATSALTLAVAAGTANVAMSWVAPDNYRYALGSTGRAVHWWRRHCRRPTRPPPPCRQARSRKASSWPSAERPSPSELSGVVGWATCTTATRWQYDAAHRRRGVAASRGGKIGCDEHSNGSRQAGVLGLGAGRRRLRRRRQQQRGRHRPTAAGGATATCGGDRHDGRGHAPTTAPAPQPTSIDEWEALWAKQRAAIVKRIKDNHWGKSADGKTLTGPEGWTVDLTKCPAGWSDTEGVTDTTIKIGQSIPLSGTYADYGNLGKAIDFLFGYYSDQGLFKDASNGKTRKVDYTMKDDGYDAARAIPNVDELLDSEKVFAIWTLGTPATLKTYDKINQRCVPQPLAMTAHAAWGDPVNHPWTTGAPQPTYSTEAILWGAFIEQHLSEFPTDRKIKVASLVQNNDFGKLYDSAFKAFVASRRRSRTASTTSARRSRRRRRP